MSLRCKRWIQTWHFRVCLRLQDFFPSNSLLNRDSGRLPDDIYWRKHDAPNLPRPCLWNLSLTQSTLYTPPDVVEFLRKMDEKKTGRCCLCGSCCLLQNQNDTCWKLAITLISLKSGKPSNLRWTPEFVCYMIYVHAYFQHSPRCNQAWSVSCQNSWNMILWKRSFSFLKYPICIDANRHPNCCRATGSQVPMSLYHVFL